MSVPRSRTIGSVCRVIDQRPASFRSHSGADTHSCWVDTTGGDVETELAHANTHTTDSQVAESEHATAVGHDADLHLLLRHARLEVLDDLAEVREVSGGEVKGRSGLRGRGRGRVDERPVLARETCDARVQYALLVLPQLDARDSPMTGV